MYSEVLDEQLRLQRWALSGEGCNFLYNYGKHALVENITTWLEKDNGSRNLIESFGPGGAALVEAVLDATTAEPYYWSPEMADMLAEVRETVPPTTLRREMFLTRTGFVYFAKPISAHTGTDLILGASWVLCDWGCTIIVYTEHMKHPGMLCPRGVFPWIWGNDHTDISMIPEHPQYYDVAGLMFGRSLMAAMLLLLGQRIVWAPKVRAERGTRRRLQKAGMPEREIQVVRLRPHVYPGLCDGTGTDDAPMWSCRWMVRGHWRQQWYASDGSHRPKWILPYVKGPDGMPLRGATKVFAVVR